MTNSRRVVCKNLLLHCLSFFFETIRYSFNCINSLIYLFSGFDFNVGFIPEQNIIPNSFVEIGNVLQHYVPPPQQTTKTKSQNKFKCHKCDRAYVHRENLKRHLRLECGVAPQYSCEHCHYKARHKSDLKRHLYLKHSELKMMIWKFWCNKQQIGHFLYGYFVVIRDAPSTCARSCGARRRQGLKGVDRTMNYAIFYRSNE